MVDRKFRVDYGTDETEKSFSIEIDAAFVMYANGDLVFAAGSREAPEITAVFADGAWISCVELREVRGNG